MELFRIAEKSRGDARNDEFRFGFTGVFRVLYAIRLKLVLNSSSAYSLLFVFASLPFTNLSSVLRAESRSINFSFAILLLS